MIGIDDILSMANKNSKHEFKGFSDIFNLQYQNEKLDRKKNKNKVISFDDYLEEFVNAGQFDHSVNKG